MGMKTFIFYVSIFIFAASTSFGGEVDLDSAAKEILKAPDWTRSEATEVANKRIGEQRGREILDIIEKHTNLSPEDARQLVIRLSASGKSYDLSISGKIYIFNRVYFNVPKMADKSDWKFFGAWGGIPQDKTTINALYPLRMTGEGKLELFYLSGSYAGPPYRGLDEFDFLLKKCGKRMNKAK